jgi:mono/diheme cytochrome c family protein
MKVLITVLVVLAVFFVFGLFMIFSGVYNISTNNHDNRLMNWALDTAMTNSVKNHADGIQAPNLDNPDMVREGAGHYHDNCIGCHGAPGVEPGEMAKGLWPEAPKLADEVLPWTPSQAFWLVKNGIKFTAMPAWGPSHSDPQLWTIVAFLQRVHTMSPAEYKSLVQGGPQGTEEEQQKSGPEKPAETQTSGAGGSSNE